MFYFDSSNTSEDVSIIIGTEGNENASSLLLCRFNKFNPMHGMKRELTPNNLFLSLYKSLSNNGIERQRTGGSSGYLQFSDELRRLLATSNSTPRCSKGSVWLRSHDNLKWFIFYIGTRDGETKQTYYTNPRPGGSFNIDPQLLKRYQCLRHFASTKAIAALLLCELTKDPDIMKYPVCPTAVASELQHIEHTRHYIKTLTAEKHGVLKGTEIETLFYQYYSSKFLNYTLVMHPVGRHIDVFADGLPSLENRMCFLLKENHEKKEKLWNLGTKYGRGGGGPNKFCFALLDWSTTKQKQNLKWTDPVNAHLKYSSQWYAREDGNPNRKLTESIWSQFSKENNIT